MRIDLADLERIALADSSALVAATNAVNDGIDVDDQRAAWRRRDIAMLLLRSAMTSPVVLAMIARIRELETAIGVLTGDHGMVAIDGVGYTGGQVSLSPAVHLALRALLERGAVVDE